MSAPDIFIRNYWLDEAGKVHDGTFWCSCEEYPNVRGFADTPEAALAIFLEAMRELNIWTQDEAKP